jgi:hypothetical protein
VVREHAYKVELPQLHHFLVKHLDGVCKYLVQLHLDTAACNLCEIVAELSDLEESLK